MSLKYGAIAKNNGYLSQICVLERMDRDGSLDGAKIRRKKAVSHLGQDTVGTAETADRKLKQQFTYLNGSGLGRVELGTGGRQANRQ